MIKRIIIGSVVVVLLVVGVWIKVEDKKEMIAIQREVANYVYNTYRLYTFDKTKTAEREVLREQYRTGVMDENTFFKELDKLYIYSEIEKIEFTGYDITPMGSLKFYYSINDVKYMYTILGAKSYETGKWKYAT
ncbi:MAG: hypothetical protein ACRC17_12105, partial [Culicoidibacterales bacterium]